jgi:hypothetical protein
MTPRIDGKKFDRWDRAYLFRMLAGGHYGRDFCRDFGIEDNIMRFTRDRDYCRAYIKTHYVR